jgi:hypothetical protein
VAFYHLNADPVPRMVAARVQVTASSPIID